MSANVNSRIHDRRSCNMIYKRFQDWQLWKVIVPLVALVIFYPVYLFKQHGGAFLGAFAHNDLLLFSALLLIEVSVEANHIQHQLEHDSPDDWHVLIEWPRALGVLLLVFYAVMKFVAEVDMELPMSKMIAYFAFCLSITSLTMTYCIYAFYKTLEKVMEGLK